MIKDVAASHGLDFVTKIERRELVEEELDGDADEEGWKISEKIKLLLSWARLVSAHYGIEVNLFF